MNNFPLEIEKRQSTGSGKINRIRHSGYIPGIIYGKGMEPTPIQIKESVLSENIRHHGRNTVFSVNLGDSDMQAVIRDIQLDPVKREYLHVDLQRIFMDQKREADVPIRIVGKSKHKSRGAVFNLQMDHITVEGLPANIPEYIEINVSDMKMGDHFTVADLLLPDNLVVKNSGNEIIVSLTPSRTIAEDLNPKDETPPNAVPIIGNDERETNAT